VVNIEGDRGILRKDRGNIEGAMKYRDRDNYRGHDESSVDRMRGTRIRTMIDDEDVMNEGKARRIR
jgi:hypothetical protein